MRRAAAIFLLLATSAGARDERRPDPCAPHPQLYISPMGAVFRAPPGAADPAGQWFAAADADHDGRLTLAEFQADATRGFAAIDSDGNGVIEPPELSAYEASVPETSLYQRGQRLRLYSGSARKRLQAYDGALGAGRYANLNIPNPVASADLDFDRGVTRDEWRTVAARRFQLLGPKDGALALATLPPTPVEASLAECASKAARTRR